MKKVSGPQVVTIAEASQMPLPAEIQEALGELVGAARDRLLALSVGLGLTVVHRLMEAEVDRVVAPKRKWNPLSLVSRSARTSRRRARRHRRARSRRCSSSGPISAHSPAFG